MNMDNKSEEAQSARDFAAKLVACSADLTTLSKDGTNKHFKYKFVSEAQVKAAVKPVLVKHGLAIMYVTVNMTEASTPSSACIKVTVTIGDGIHEAVFQGVGAGTDSGDKAPMKATAAAMKYALTNAFIIPTNDDPEADPETDKAATEPKTRRPSARASKTSTDGAVPAPTKAADDADESW